MSRYAALAISFYRGLGVPAMTYPETNRTVTAPGESSQRKTRWFRGYGHSRRESAKCNQHRMAQRPWSLLMDLRVTKNCNYLFDGIRKKP